MIDIVLRMAIYYFEAFAKRPLWLIVPAVLTVAAGVAVILLLPRSYQSEAQLLIEAPQSPSSLLPATVASEQLQFVEQRVLARDKLLALAEELDLFPGLRSTMSDTMLAELMRRHIFIHTVASAPSDRYSGTSAMRIGFTASTAEQASAAVSALVNRIIEENRGLRIQRASELSEFLSREVSQMSEKMKKREADWQSFFEDNADAMPSRAQSLDNELQEKQRELTGIEHSITTLDQELRLLEAELRLGRQRPEAAARDRTQLAELESELAAKSLTFSEAHPEIRALSQRIEGIRLKIRSETGPAADNAVLTPDLALVAERVDITKARHESLVVKRSTVSERITWLRGVMARAPAVLAQFEAIERERETMRGSLDEMIGRLSAARVGERLELDNATGHVQVLEQPETPRYPASPNRTRLLILVLAVACMAGAGGLYLGDSLQRTIRGTFDLTAPLAGSTLVVIPRWFPTEPRKKLFRRVVPEFNADRPATI